MDTNSDFSDKNLDKLLIGSYDWAVKYNKGQIPPEKSYTRHQYFYAFDSTEFDSWSPIEQSNAILKCAGSAFNALLMEEVLYTDKWTIFRLWMDIPENQNPFQEKIEKT